MEELVKVETYLVKMICEKCNMNGEMKPTGSILLCNPPLYEYMCNKCYKTENYNKEYPHYSYKKLDIQ